MRLAEERSEMNVKFSQAPLVSSPGSLAAHTAGPLVPEFVPRSLVAPFGAGCCGGLSNSAAGLPHLHKHFSESFALSSGTETSLPVF